MMSTLLQLAECAGLPHVHAVEQRDLVGRVWLIDACRCGAERQTWCPAGSDIWCSGWGTTAEVDARRRQWFAEGRA